MSEQHTLKGWFVGYLNLDTGKVGYDCFTDPTESEARKSFRACYRHHNYRILCCVAYCDWEYDELTGKHKRVF